MSNYPQLHGINSSVCEQYHSFLSAFCASATQMKQSTFMRFMRCWIDLWNFDVFETLTRLAL